MEKASRAKPRPLARSWACGVSLEMPSRRRRSMSRRAISVWMAGDRLLMVEIGLLGLAIELRLMALISEGARQGG